MNGLLKYFYALVVTLFIACAGTVAFAQSAPDQVASGLRRGDASAISQHFGELVDITINKTQNNYSPAQAEMVLRDWFGKNNPTRYEAEHSGTSSGNTVYFAIGQLSTGNGKFRVYLLFKQRDNTLQLNEIRFEKL